MSARNIPCDNTHPIHISRLLKGTKLLNYKNRFQQLTNTFYSFHDMNQQNELKTSSVSFNKVEVLSPHEYNTEMK